MFIEEASGILGNASSTLEEQGARYKLQTRLLINFYYCELILMSRQWLG